MAATVTATVLTAAVSGQRRYHVSDSNISGIMAAIVAAKATVSIVVVS